MPLHQADLLRRYIGSFGRSFGWLNLRQLPKGRPEVANDRYVRDSCLAGGACSFSLLCNKLER